MDLLYHGAILCLCNLLDALYLSFNKQCVRVDKFLFGQQSQSCFLYRKLQVLHIILQYSLQAHVIFCSRFLRVFVFTVKYLSGIDSFCPRVKNLVELVSSEVSAIIIVKFEHVFKPYG